MSVKSPLGYSIIKGLSNDREPDPELVEELTDDFDAQSASTGKTTRQLVCSSSRLGMLD
jgi:hypothetical protein